MDADIKLDESLHSVEVPCMDINVVDRRCKYKDTVNLTNAVCGEVHADAVEEAVLQVAQGGVDSNVENVSCREEKDTGCYLIHFI